MDEWKSTAEGFPDLFCSMLLGFDTGHLKVTGPCQSDLRRRFGEAVREWSRMRQWMPKFTFGDIGAGKRGREGTVYPNIHDTL